LQDVARINGVESEDESSVVLRERIVNAIAPHITL
jgi:hypothetical protein